MPLIGPSVDRRTLTLVCRLARSETLKGLVCFACAQLFTSVKSWECMYKPSRNPHSQAYNSDIRMCKVSDTLLCLEMKDLEAFMRNFSLEEFRKRYARADSACGNPLEGAHELDPDSVEWQRRLLIPEKGLEITLLCCPEDVQMGRSCKHSQAELCAECMIPLCQQCEGA